MCKVTGTFVVNEDEVNRVNVSTTFEDVESSEWASNRLKFIFSAIPDTHLFRCAIIERYDEANVVVMTTNEIVLLLELDDGSTIRNIIFFISISVASAFLEDRNPFFRVVVPLNLDVKRGECAIVTIGIVRFFPPPCDELYDAHTPCVRRVSPTLEIVVANIAVLFCESRSVLANVG